MASESTPHGSESEHQAASPSRDPQTRVPSSDTRHDRVRPRDRRMRVGLILAVLLLSQFILFGPSLVGGKILLPLDLLAYPGFYLPQTPEYADVKPGHQVFTDQLFEYEMSRRFVVSELREGRIPLWNPHGYTGAPFANFFKYSPFMWPYYLFGAPWTLAWIQLLVALVAGAGTYVFARRVLDLSVWSSGVAACLYPLTGFYMLWQGFSLPYVTAWFPWLLVATDRTVRSPLHWSGPVLALLTTASLVSGQVDVAGQALLASGIFAIWRVTGASRAQSDALPSRRTPWLAMGSVLAAWLLGFLIASPYLLPLSEYVKTGSRFTERTEGAEERPPIGFSALPQIVVPNVYGTSREDSAYLAPGNQLEGPGTAYAGLVLTLILAPLAFRSRRHRPIAWLLAGLALLGLSWDLNLPGFVQLLRLPGLNIMSHNRFVFVSAFAILSLAAIGIETLRGRDSDPDRDAGGSARVRGSDQHTDAAGSERDRGPDPHPDATGSGIDRGRGSYPDRDSKLSVRWLAGLAILPIIIGAWCVYRGLNLPEPIATGLEQALQSGKPMFRAVDMPAVRAMQASFSFEYFRGALLCLIALGVLAVLASRFGTSKKVRIGVAVILWGELISTAYGFHSQRDPELYFPSIPALDELAKVDRDRVVGVGCLPPNLHERFGFRDVRGYDGVDPALIVQVLELARDPRVPGTRYAKLLSLAPRGGFTPEGEATLPAVMSMLNVRYMIFRGSPPPGAKVFLRSDDYWICENKAALPRPFVPKHVEQIPEADVLEKLASASYDPRVVAYISNSGVPSTDPLLKEAISTEVNGAAEITSEHPTRIEIAYAMRTPGLVVLADLWDAGWRARVNGVEAPILRTNHAVRGVLVPAGEGTLSFEYRPRGLILGAWLLALALLALVTWTFAVRIRYGRRTRGGA